MQIRIAAVLGVVFAVSGCRVVEPSPPPEAPQVTAFTASKTRTAPGEEVTLTFTTTRATKVELTDDSGNFIELSGTPESGTAKVAPTRSAFYVLRATGLGGRDSAFVQIAVNEPLKDVFLIAIPPVIASGEQGQLLWGAAGATSVTLKPGSAAAMPLTGTTGTVTVTPATTEQYTLTAQGAPGTPPLTALAEIQVRPVLSSATVVALAGVKPGETLTFAWKTAGAAQLTVSEQTFGTLHTETDAASVANGTFDWVVPATLPNGIDVTDGLPLRFTVVAGAGGFSVSRNLTAVVGDLPVIDELVAPDFASLGRPFTVSWKTVNAAQVAITVGGLPVFQTLPGDQARVNAGSLSLPAPAAMTEYTLVATNSSGASVSRVFTVRSVALPAITMYSLTPTLNQVGDPATARWTTTNASRVQLRLLNGPTLAVVTTPSQVASGNVVLTPATSCTVILEAYNAAGDVVTDSKPITLNVSAVTLAPTPVIRGNPVTLTWSLASASVVETVGLPTTAPAAMPNSPNFLDLGVMGSTAEVVRISDPNGGATKLVLPSGFAFPLLGTVRPELYVSVDGYIAFSAPGARPLNEDLTAASAPSVIAPFWDDLTMGPSSRILFAPQVALNGERYLVVQWDKLQLAGDGSSELTFQAHLYETGQVAFIYKTLVGALDSATIGIKDGSWPAVEQYVYNAATPAPVPDLELNYFTAGPADGMLSFNASASKRINFFGRTATGRVPASAELRAFGPGDVKVSEAMPFPEATSTALGQWVELQNTAAVPVDFDGLVVDSLGSSVDGGYLIPPGSVVPAGGFLVLGQSTDLTDTGGAPVQQVATDLPLGSVDRVRVQLQGTVLSQLTWDAGVPGTSIIAPESLLVAAGQTFACNRMTTFGSAGALGTPGANNEACAPYVLSSIPGAFVTAPPGSDAFTTLSGDEGYGDAPLPVPFKYFGQMYSSLSLSNNGFITLGAPLASAHITNNTAVSTTAPNGVLAPFWDDCVRDTGKNAMWRQGDRTIITFENYRPFGSAFAGSVLNFQIHLVDNGVIEFHYGAISTPSTTQSTIDRMTGNSATIWIERPDGVIAIPHAINQVNSVAPNSGLRFTPTTP